MGLTIPGIVPNVLDNPNRMLAYWGAISKGLMLCIKHIKQNGQGKSVSTMERTC